MNAALQVLRFVVPALYAGTFLNYLVYFLKGNRIAGRLTSPLLGGSVLIHTIYNVLRGIRFGHHPMASIWEILSVTALALAIVYLLAELWRRNKSTGVFVLPFVFLIQISSAIGIGPTYEINPILRDAWFGFHTGSITLAYCAFFLSAVYGIMLLLLHRALRKKKFGLLFDRLPSLATLARMNRGSTLVGFVFLTVSIVVGMLWALEKYPNDLFNARVISVFIFWAMFGFSLAAHYIFKWSNRHVAILMLAGFFTMVLSSAVVNMLIASWHDFGV